MFWSKGKVNISGGTFVDNESSENGGVFFCSESSIFTLVGGIFENNTSEDGAVAVIDKDASLLVESGVFSGNVADSQGGVFAVNEGGVIKVGRWNTSLRTSNR